MRKRQRAEESCCAAEAGDLVMDDERVCCLHCALDAAASAQG